MQLILKILKILKKLKKINFACVYTGSFFKGKGVELIQQISNLMKDVKFYLYGDKSTLVSNIKLMNYKNMIFKGNVDYSRIPTILNKFEIIFNALHAQSLCKIKTGGSKSVYVTIKDVRLSF